jgi:large subunit ribosomal protein L30
MPEKAKSTKRAKSAPRKKAAAKSTKKTTKKATKKTTTKAASAATPEAATKVRVRQVRSGIGHAATYRRTLRALGLRHHQHAVVLPDNASVRGMLFKVRHLVQVTSEEA